MVAACIRGCGIAGVAGGVWISRRGVGRGVGRGFGIGRGLTQEGFDFDLSRRKAMRGFSQAQAAGHDHVVVLPCSFDFDADLVLDFPAISSHKSAELVGFSEHRIVDADFGFGDTDFVAGEGNHLDREDAYLGSGAALASERCNARCDHKKSQHPSSKRLLEESKPLSITHLCHSNVSKR